MDHKLLNLWCAYPDDLRAGGAAEACRALVSEEERARVARFRFERSRLESLTTRALMRTALSRYRPVEPQDWRFKLNEHGKPSVEPECGLQFNLSNSVGLVVCLVSEGAELGVDVEPFDRSEKILELAPEVFSPVERAQLEALPEAERLDRALSLWTLKEAYIKARGMGLALALDKISFVFGGPEGIQLEIDASLGDEAGRWNFFQLDYAEHRIAGMVDRRAGRYLDVWEARPVLAAPVRLDGSGVRWFPCE